jgi:hypothetical protein
MVSRTLNVEPIGMASKVVAASVCLFVWFDKGNVISAFKKPTCEVGHIRFNLLGQFKVESEFRNTEGSQLADNPEDNMIPPFRKERESDLSKSSEFKMKLHAFDVRVNGWNQGLASLLHWPTLGIQVR